MTAHSSQPIRTSLRGDTTFFVGTTFVIARSPGAFCQDDEAILLHSIRKNKIASPTTLAMTDFSGRPMRTSLRGDTTLFVVATYVIARRHDVFCRDDEAIFLHVIGKNKIASPKTLAMTAHSRQPYVRHCEETRRFLSWRRSNLTAYYTKE
jgi:hypothetical protein